MDEQNPTLELFYAGRAALKRGEYEQAVTMFRISLAQSIHFKSLELEGEALCRLGRHREAIIPLAAATGLNRGSRSPCLLSEAFNALSEWREAKQAAEEALRRTPGYKRAQAAHDEAVGKLNQSN